MVFLRSLLALALCVLMLWPGPAQAAPGPVLYAEAAILIDGETGQVLYEKNARRQMEPASLTKILTCLMAMEEAAREAPLGQRRRLRSGDPSGGLPFRLFG